MINSNEESKKGDGPKGGQKATRKPALKKAEVSRKAKDLYQTGKEKLSQIPFESIWERLKKEASVAVKAIGKGTEKAAGKTVAMSKQAGIQYQVYLTQLKLKNALAELGGRVYDLSRTHSPSLVLNDPDATPIISKIAELDEKILKLKDQAKALKKS